MSRHQPALAPRRPPPAGTTVCARVARPARPRTARSPPSPRPCAETPRARGARDWPLDAERHRPRQVPALLAREVAELHVALEHALAPPGHPRHAPEACGPAVAALLARLDLLRAELAAALWLPLDRVELQLARYTRPGARYARHRDTFRASDDRRITAVYYLNPAWIPAHGGCLRMHLDGAGPLDVAPLLDRLVVFASASVDHEVLPVHAPRLALTAWMGRDDPLARLR